MNVDAVLFDLDGTLADTLVDIADSMNQVFAAHGLPTYSHLAYRRHVGEGVVRLVARLAPSATHLVDQLVVEFGSAYADRLLHNTLPYPGIPELVSALRERSIPMAVLSNKPEWATQKIVSSLFPAVRFAAVVGFREEVPRKPDPTSALAIARQIGAPPPACALIGDTAIDMKTAAAAGMVPVGVTWGFRDRAELVDAGAAVLLETPAQFLDLLS